MNKKISAELQAIEKKHQVQILYACESGSRAWGFPSKDSDYDVRFIYIHKPDWYLSIEDKRDVIELPIDELLDINGWDLRKALNLFRKSNPPLMEWLKSDIVYKQNDWFLESMQELTNDYFSPLSCAHHYLNMARNNNRGYLQGDKVRIKKYFYVLRPLLACLWIQQYQSMPPMRFQELAHGMLPSGELNEQVEKLLERKTRGEELGTEPRVEIIHEFIEQTLPKIESFLKDWPKNERLPAAPLDRLFREALNLNREAN
ncbi:nucleotidyltransferase domain-containing protein [Bacillus gobiensis]|uniref:nucleotidyltransferase domain-containing protein n=1 Tax=Bacillus gobiensis TaxID=1441095 RepID=UPI003D1E7BBB